MLISNTRFPARDSADPSFIARRPAGEHAEEPVSSRRPSWGGLFLAVFYLFWAGSALATDLEGRVKVLEKAKDRTAQEARYALVYFQPDRPVKPDPLDETTAITMTRKQFAPRVTAVTLGSEIDFPNEDGILHNVFSLSGENRFDLGLYRRGKSESARFDHPGIVQVFCNVHHSMVAYVLVLDTPFYTRVGRDGAFRLENVPPGPGKLVVWHERAEPKSLRVTVPKTGELDITLELSKPKIPPHRNKFGKPYSRKRRGKAY